MRKIDETRYDDRWYMTLGKEERLLFDYLICKADRGGFVKVNEVIWSRDTLLSVSECLEATKRLCEPLRGSTRVFKRLEESTGEEIVWLKNYVKVQCSKRLVVTNSWHVGVWNRLREMMELFPEIEGSYSVSKGLQEARSGYEGLVDARRLSKDYKRRREKYKYKNSSLGESENPFPGDGLSTDSPAMKLAGKYLEQLRREGSGSHAGLKVESLARMLFDRPDVDWKNLISYAIGKDLNGGVRDMYGYLGTLSMDPKWMLKGGKVVELDAGKLLAEEKVKAIEKRYRDQEITPEECREQTEAVLEGRA